MYRILFISIIFFFSACKDKVEDPIIEIKENKGIAVEITHSAGDYLKDNSLLPLPYNLAKRSNIDFIVLHSRYKHGKKVHTDPIGMAEFISADTTKYTILSIPHDSKKKYQINSFLDFATKHHNTLWMIEQYLSNPTNNLNGDRFVKWHDDNKTKSFLFTETNSTNNH